MTDAVAAPAEGAPPANVDYSALVASGAVPSAEHAAAMLQRNQGPVQSEPVVASPPDPTGRPTDVPEKFWDPVKREVRTDLVLKSYLELEKTRAPAPAASPAAAAEKPAAAAEAKPGDPAKPDTLKVERPAEDAANPLTAAVAAVRDQYAQSGEVTPEAIKSLTDLGLPPEVVDTYLAGVRALEASAVLAAHEAAGGKETFQAAVQFAQNPANVSDADLAAYNDMVANPKTQRQAVEWLVGKYRAANPSEGNLVSTTELGAGPGDTFKSTSELTAAMSDPKYRTDPAFRQSVAEKLARSKQAGHLNTGVQHFSSRR